MRSSNLKQQNSLNQESVKQAEPITSEKEKKVGLKRIFALTKDQWGTLGIGLLALAIASSINLAFPYLIKMILNENLGLQIKEDLGMITGILIVMFAVQAVFFYIRHYCFTVAGHRMVTDLRNKLYSSIINQDIAFFDSSRVGDLITRLSSDTQLLQKALTVNISVCVRYVLQVVGGICLMAYISIKLTLSIVLLIPILAVAGMYWGKKLKGLSRKMQEELGSSSITAEEAISNIRTVRIFAGNGYEESRYQDVTNEVLNTGIARTKVAAVFSSFMVFLIHSGIAVVIYLGGRMVIAEKLSIGDMTAFLLYCAIVAISFGFLSSVWDEFMQALGAGERIFQIIDRKPEIVSPLNPKHPNLTPSEIVRFSDVSFNYPARPEVEVLKNISFEIKPDTKVALVGPSGSGKSTITTLISRFYDTTSGTIEFAGENIKELDLIWLRNNISVVAQDPQVFSVSIAENIAYGKIGATSEEIETAAKSAHIHEFVSSLPNGYKTLVGDKGVQLSGGQKQRIAIARAILKNPKLLILDEATSALDSENEKLIQQALNNLTQGRTTLVIAHRLSTVSDADTVLVLKEGQIIETGTHEELLAKNGFYKTLVSFQMID